MQKLSVCLSAEEVWCVCLYENLCILATIYSSRSTHILPSVILVLAYLIQIIRPTIISWEDSRNRYFYFFCLCVQFNYDHIDVMIFDKIFYIRCTSWFDAWSMIIVKLQLRGCFFIFLAPAGHYPNPVPNPAGQSLPLTNLTWPKIGINFIIFHNPYKQHFTRRYPGSIFLCLLS